MKTCKATYKNVFEAFEGAKLIVNDLSEVSLSDLIACKVSDHVIDDRVVVNNS